MYLLIIAWILCGLALFRTMSLNGDFLDCEDYVFGFIFAISFGFPLFFAWTLYYPYVLWRSYRSLREARKNWHLPSLNLDEFKKELFITDYEVVKTDKEGAIVDG
jgi:hypothetical protein